MRPPRVKDRSPFAGGLASACGGALLSSALLAAGCATEPSRALGVLGLAPDTSHPTADAAALRPVSYRPDAPPLGEPDRPQPAAVPAATHTTGRLGIPVGAEAASPQEGAPTRAPEKSDQKGETLPAPRAATTTGITLDQAVNATLLADPKIRAGLEAINQANADLLTTSLPPNPTLTSDIQLLPLTRPFTVTRQGGPPQTDHQISYPIDWFLFGKRAAAMASAATGVRISEADYADLVRTRVADSAVAFFDVAEAKALLDLARQDLENLRRVEAATRKAVEAGGRPAVELNRIRLDVFRSEQTLREAESTLAVTKAKLRALLGRRDTDPAFDVAANLNVPLSAQPLGVEDALTQAEQNRPDIRSLRLQVDKATQDIHTEKTKAYPQVAPLLDYTHQFQQKAIGFPDADSWMMAFTTTLPFFDRNQGNVAKARSVLVQNSYNLEAGRVDLRAEIVQVVQEFQLAYRNATAVATSQLKIATDVRDSITKAYEVGGRSLLEVLDAQRNYRETYRLYISSRANYWRSAYRFSSAIGRQFATYDDTAR